MSRLRRRVVPRLVVALSRITWPARRAAAVRRRLGRPGRVELFFAFDDPCSAVAVLDLAERVRGRHVRLVLLPVVRRGIPGDPAVEQKRRYALADARRRAARAGLALARSEPLCAGDTAHLAAGEPDAEACIAALRRVWLGGEAPADIPPAGAGDDAVRRNERRMCRRGPYDVPAAWVHGRWFFAHDRGPQIATWLDDLGWTVHRS